MVEQRHLMNNVLETKVSPSTASTVRTNSDASRCLAQMHDAQITTRLVAWSLDSKHIENQGQSVDSKHIKHIQYRRVSVHGPNLVDFWNAFLLFSRGGGCCLYTCSMAVRKVPVLCIYIYILYIYISSQGDNPKAQMCRWIVAAGKAVRNRPYQTYSSQDIYRAIGGLKG
jgi:hypothetical protein